MTNPILIKRSDVAAKVPATTDLALGELAINTVDGKLYLKKNVSGTDTVVEVGPVTSVSGRTGVVTLTSSDVGLSNVNNTADSVKAVASATVAASANAVAGANVSGTVALAAKAGTVTTAAQPNITSVGVLTSLSIAKTGSGLLLVGTAPNTALRLDWGSAGYIAIYGSGGNNLRIENTYGQPNVNLVVSGNITSSNYTICSITNGIVAAGSTQATATVIAKSINVVSTVTAGQGVVLPVAVAGLVVIVMNTSATALLVYPNTSASINSEAINVGYSLAAGARLEFVAVSATQWYTLA